MNIDERAPVRSTRDLRIDARPDLVWSVLTDINGWPKWNPAVSRAKFHGPLAPGSEFRWKSGGSSIVSTFQEVEGPTRVSWTGKAFGTGAVHVWTLEAAGTGTQVRTSESFDGWLVRLLRSWFQRLLEKALDEQLQSLKTAAEERSATSSVEAP